ncbi:MAG: hypothetical protein HPY71_14550 [Firmicutes bacterium]|nr:hypothetical protein [Bacillota bacterium]
MTTDMNLHPGLNGEADGAGNGAEGLTTPRAACYRGPWIEDVTPGSDPRLRRRTSRRFTSSVSAR